MDGLKKAISSFFVKKDMNMTEGPIIGALVSFAIPFFLGQLLQQLYNVADAWVIGNFADNASFAAVSTGGNLIFLIIGFCNGLALGGSVIISRYFGAEDKQNVSRAIHTNVLMGMGTSIVSTTAGLFLVPFILRMMNIPDNVLPNSLTYMRIYFAGSVTIVMYNVFTSILRALGDTVRPLIFLAISSVTNVVLDLLFVAVFHWGVAGAATATVISQGLSAALCLMLLLRRKDYTGIRLSELKFYPQLMKDCLLQGIPTGIQNTVISIGNIVIQSNINAFGEAAMAGHGAYMKLEGFAFLPITCVSMTLPTFVSQNLGAKKYDRAKKGAFLGILFGVLLGSLVGLAIIVFKEPLLGIFIKDAASIEFGSVFASIPPAFYCILSYSHCSAGVLRGSGKSIVPMIAMLLSWCVIRITYITIAIQYIPEFSTIAWAYPITWSITTVIFSVFLFFTDWTKGFEKKVRREKG